MSEIHVTGLKALNDLLQTLPAKLERNVLGGALRAGAKVIKAEAVANVPKQSGELRDSLTIRTNSKGGTVTAAVRTKVWYARFVEFGTASHTIRAKDGGKLFFGGVYRDQVNHPGIKTKGYLRPAMDAKSGAAVVAAGEHMKRRLQTKEGLDTSDIEIGEV